MEYTKEMIKEKLATDNRWLEHGIVAIWNYQTTSEKAAGVTKELNGVGFNGCDAEFLSSLAEWIKKSNRPSGEKLSVKQAAIARRKMLKYAGQLSKIAG
jgi:hypothetical protein